MLSTTTNNVNITVVFSEIDLYGINLSEISSAIREKFDSAKPIINQFPDLISIIVPEKQLTLTIDQRRLITSDQSVTLYAQRDMDTLVELASKTIDILRGSKAKDIKAYGFNFSVITFSEKSKYKSGEYLTSLFLAKNKGPIEKKLGTRKISSTGYRITFSDDKKRYDLRIEPEFDRDLVSTNRFVINQNVHFATNIFPSKAKLDKSISQEYDSLIQRIAQLLNMQASDKDEQKQK